MTKQLAIAALDKGAGIPQQRHDRMPGRRHLPFVAVQAAGIENDLRNLLLGCAVTKTVKCLQHTTQTGALLARQARVGRDHAAMKRGEKAMNGFEAIEPLEPERHGGDERCAVSIGTMSFEL